MKLHIHRYEKFWLLGGLAMLAIFLATITTAAVVDGFVPPSHVQSIDPEKVSITPPFDHPGLRRAADGSYQAYYVGHIFAWEPNTLRIPRGGRVTFYVTSTDVVHGFSIPGTGINAMVSPGWVTTTTHTFRTPGTYLLICNEYCGSAHQAMAASITVR